MLHAMSRCAVLLLMATVLAAGCSRSPEAQKARHLERGDQYLQKGQNREAVIEYSNVLRIDPNDARAGRQLGLAHYQLGEFGRAFPYLVKASELEPDNADLRLKLARVYLLSRRPVEAQAHVATVLGKEPKNFEALLLSSGTVTTPQEADAAITRLEAARADFGDKAKLHLALGTLYLRKRDVAKAEFAFREAVAKEPKSLEAHTALGDFFIAKRDIPQAEAEYKAAAELSPAGSEARLKLANFYLASGRPDEGKRILTEMTQKAPDFLPAWRRLADIALSEQKYDESLKALEPVFKKNPSDLEGRMLRGRVHLAKGETTEAIDEFQKLLKLDPGLVFAIEDGQTMRSQNFFNCNEGEVGKVFVIYGVKLILLY
jgi:tetratricopeptide (TPR) repeat protein